MEDCIFCKIIRGDEKSWKILETDKSYAFLDINPASRYHTLVIPKEHYENIFDIPEEILPDVISLVKRICKLYERQLGIKNIQIISNSGIEAQQDVFHIHFHIVPRLKGDGQNIKWQTYSEWRSEFQEMISKLEYEKY